MECGVRDSKNSRFIKEKEAEGLLIMAGKIPLIGPLLTLRACIFLRKYLSSKLVHSDSNNVTSFTQNVVLNLMNLVFSLKIH